MTSQLIKNKGFIIGLNKSKNITPQLKKLIRKSSNGEIKALCELCFNILRGNVDICKSRKNRLSPHADMLRYLGDKKISIIKKRKKLLKGKGIFLSALLPLAVSLISGLIKK